MRRVAMVGGAISPFGERFATPITELMFQAATDAIANVDKGASVNDVDAVWVGQMQPVDGVTSALVADSLGLFDVPVTRVENQCASGSDAIRNAAMAVASGHVDVALVVGVDKTRERPTSATLWEWMGLARNATYDLPLGLIAPANFALHARRYMHTYNVEREHAARVAVKNHGNGARNPNAHIRMEVTVEQVLAAPRVVDPFGVLDCAPQSDGAAAVVLVGEEVVDRYTSDPVWLTGFGVGHDFATHAAKPDLSTIPATTRAAKQAYAMAGLNPDDLDVAEVHDCFTVIEMMDYEDLGFCGRGEAPQLIDKGMTELTGSLPVNPSGGLKARGHPPGATGVAQSVEMLKQLRGQAINQVDAARHGLVHNVGGPTAVACVLVYSTIAP